MGAVLQTAGAAELVAELTCCAASSVCGLITRDSATRAKFRYCSFLLLATVTCVILLIPGLRTKLDKIPNLCGKTVSSETCDKFVGFNAVYRILISTTVFHFLLSILTIGVTRVNSFRARFNNGLWLFKMGLIFGLTIASFYIPRKTGFFRWWMYISLTGGFMFVMFQIVLVIDFGHSWSLSWAEKLETGYTKCWYLAMALVTLLMFSLSFGALISFYIFFTHPPQFMKCQANLFYITFMCIQCFLATIVSITPAVQQELSGAGLLQSSVVVLYTMYLTWNTLSSEPDSTCNPLGNIILEYDSLTGVSGESIFGCLLTLVLLLFACTVRANTSHLGRYGLALAESEAFALATYNEDIHKENVEKQLETGEKEVSLEAYVGYNYSFFHIIMSLASLHILMVLTNWHSPDEKADMKRLIKNWASVWVQMASSFVCLLVYVWFLVTPLVKRVWGPLFGVFMDDEYEVPPPNKYKKHDAPQSKKYKDLNEEQTTAIHTAEKLMITNTERKVIQTQPAPHHEIEKRPESRNSFIPGKVKPRKLKRVNSEESILSVISVRSNNTTTHHRESKHKKKLIVVHETEDDDNDDDDGEKSSVIRKKIILPNKREKHTNVLEKQSLHSSCESLASCASKYSKTNTYKSKKSRTKVKRTPSMHSDDTDVLTPITNNKNFPENSVVDVELTAEEQQTGSTSMINSAAAMKRKHKHHLPIKKVQSKSTIKNQPSPKDPTTSLAIEAEPCLDEPSLVPSVFHREPQKPDTAQEILQLQWKILRTQAKVVKIQERIIRLQSESEVTGANISPKEQSTLIETSVKKTKHKSRTKELG